MSVKEFYFGSIDEKSEKSHNQSFGGDGKLQCKLQCIEWSDGRLGCSHKAPSIVQRSRKSGDFIWLSDYIAEGVDMNKSNNAQHYSFKDLEKAYNQLKDKGALNDERYFSLLLEIVQAYNDIYHRNGNVEKEAPFADFLFYVECIVEIEKKGKNHMPASILAELYREIGMFGKCFEFDATSADSKDEMELITEIQYRAARGDKRLFIIEHCEYFQENLRLRKRTPCPLSE